MVSSVEKMFGIEGLESVMPNMSAGVILDPSRRPLCLTPAAWVGGQCWWWGGGEVISGQRIVCPSPAPMSSSLVSSPRAVSPQDTFLWYSNGLAVDMRMED